MKRGFFMLLAVACIIFSCNKDDDQFVNLISTLSLENSVIGSTEGSYIFINLSLSDRLSQDLVLEGAFSTEGIDAYINDEDYSKELEYSVDGREWKKEANPARVIFASGTVTLKIRIETTDDNILETQEFFRFTLTPVDAAAFTLTNELTGFTGSLIDNEESQGVSEQGVVMEFSLAEDYESYTVTGVAAQLSNSFEKEVLDGLYQKPVEDALAAFKLLPSSVRVSTFQLIADPNSGLGGYVFNQDQSGTDDWAMGMNVSFAFFDATSFDRIPYNDSGEYGNIFAHELGHIMTLNFAHQIDFLPEGQSCNTYANVEGCAKENAELHLFYENFYHTPPSTAPTHVTDYAMTNLEEDFAETFAHYMIQESLPASNSSSSGALQKLNFVKERTDLSSLKSDLQSIYKLAYIGNQENILAKHVDKNGNPISCLNHKALLEMHNEE